jgi:hypothetical protein
MAGAYGALGGDFYSLSQNPAGLGVYRRSEIIISPKISLDYSNSDFGDDKKSQSLWADLSNNSLGLVLTSPQRDKGFIGANFAFGFNKINDFTSKAKVEGINSNVTDYYGSRVDYIFDTLQKIGVAPDLLGINFDEIFDFGMYPYSGLINYDTLNLYTIDSNIPISPRQVHTITTKGHNNEWVFSTGFNFFNRLFFGASFTYNSFSYSKDIYHKEYDPTDNFELFSHYENLEIDATGFSGKFGLIAVPVNFIRFGFAYHTPATYYVKELYSANLWSYHKGNNLVYPYELNYGERESNVMKYKIRSPQKIVASLAFDLFNRLMVSSDLEYIDYSTSRLNQWKYTANFYNTNAEIDTIYRDNIIFKAGLEYRKDMFRLRGGVGYYGSPFISNLDFIESYTMTYSGGIGLRSKKVFLDISYVYRATNYSYELFYKSGLASEHNALHTLMVTAGLKF